MQKITLTLLLVSFVNISAAFAQKAHEILKKSDQRRGLEGSFFVVAKTISVDAGEKQVNQYEVKVLDPDTSLVEQTEPIRARGRRLLMRGLDMWLMTPDIKKPVRISLQQKLTGEIQNGDISRTNYADDYEAEILPSESNGESFVLDLKAKDKKVTYERIKYWIEKKTYRPQKAEFFASSGKKLKIASFSGYKKIDGLERMTKVSIEDAVNASKRSEINYSGHKKMKFDQSQFNKDLMIR